MARFVSYILAILAVVVFTLADETYLEPSRVARDVRPRYSSGMHLEPSRFAGGAPPLIGSKVKRGVPPNLPQGRVGGIIGDELDVSNFGRVKRGVPPRIVASTTGGRSRRSPGLPTRLTKPTVG